MKFMLLIAMASASFMIHAQEIFPKGCVPYAIHGDQVNLSTKKSMVVMIHNLSNTELWIIHPAMDASTDVGSSSRLESGRWSALALDKQSKPYKLNCIESKPGHEQQIPCVDVLAVCKWPNANRPEKKSGIFWAGENMDMLPLKAYIERLGFILEQHGEP